MLVRRPPSPDEQNAYYQAGAAVIARHYDIPVLRVALEGGSGAGSLPKLAPLELLCVKCQSSAKRTGLIESYVTTLLAASVGRLLHVEQCFGYQRQCNGQKHLERRAMLSALHGDDPLSDRACYLAFTQLTACDGGDADATVMRLWRQANRLLRAGPHCQFHQNLALSLMKSRELFVAEILEAMD
ncbi:hypothetical protein [Lacipirellula limnantheis]|uniref:Uncharacterized protein n=1 Tax=Lacipirellula limnantheis TaxID=2528024 RepID=A0A517TTU2_9BACT|nr:hypothetical protein [Lacipirellula limnantheis]QDT71797.1 hypothetical protein I41_09570 [Lacipirellula limnantheis]